MNVRGRRLTARLSKAGLVLVLVTGLLGGVELGLPAPVGAAVDDITTVAGSGNGTGYQGNCAPADTLRLNDPRGVTVASNGDTIVADFVNARVRRVNAATDTMSTIAGTGTAGFSGDGGLATASQLNTPTDVALDSSDNLYIADQSNHRIRRIDAVTGIITTVAGTGVAGDGGNVPQPATSVELNNPYGVALDADDNLYIADLLNDRVRRVDGATGTMTTFAGTGTAGFSGDGGPAIGALLNEPIGIAVDAHDNVYIANYGDHRVRMVDGSTGIITTVAGTGTGGFNGDGLAAAASQLNYPNSVDVDADGMVYIADQWNHRIRKLTNTGILVTVAGTGTAGFSGDGGPAASAQLYFPASIGVSPDGRLHIADQFNQRIRRVEADLDPITTIAGTGTAGFDVDCLTATNAALALPQAVALDVEGNLYIADTFNHRVRKVDAVTGNITTVAGTDLSVGPIGDGGPAASAQLRYPKAVALDSYGNLYIADTGHHRVRKVFAVGGAVTPLSFITTVAGTGVEGHSGGTGLARDTNLSSPAGLAIDPELNMYIADLGSNRIRRVQLVTGTIHTVAGDGIADFGDDGGPATEARLYQPISVALGPTGDLYLAESEGIRRIDAVGGAITHLSTITTVTGTGVPGFSGDGGPASSATIWNPQGVALDANGNLYIADIRNQRVRRVDAVTRTIATTAGDGEAGYGGDGGPATASQLNGPTGVALGATGDLYIADMLNNRIRRVESPSGPPQGQMRVTTSPALPASVIVDGVARDSWGMTWADFLAGAHEVCFGAMPGFTPPPCQDVTVLDGQATIVNGTYTARGYLRVLTSPALPSTISVDGVPRNDWGVWTEVAPGTYNVCFGAVSNFTPPACQNAVVTAGNTTTITGNFVASPGAPSPGGTYGFLRATTSPAVGSRISVDGAWRDSWGLTWLKVPTGAHEVCFEGVLYTTTPSCQNVNVTAGSTTVVTGSFAAHGFLRVLTSPVIGATIYVDSQPANAWGVWTSKPPGTYEVCYEPQPGFDTPACEDAVVTAGTTTTVTGTYTPG